jgi:hypothetical protein
VVGLQNNPRDRARMLEFLKEEEIAVMLFGVLGCDIQSVDD